MRAPAWPASFCTSRSASADKPLRLLRTNPSRVPALIAVPAGASRRTTMVSTIISDPSSEKRRTCDPGGAQRREDRRRSHQGQDQQGDPEQHARDADPEARLPGPASTRHPADADGRQHEGSGCRIGAHDHGAPDQPSRRGAHSGSVGCQDPRDHGPQQSTGREQEDEGRDAEARTAVARSELRHHRAHRRGPGQAEDSATRHLRSRQPKLDPGTVSLSRRVIGLSKWGGGPRRTSTTPTTRNAGPSPDAVGVGGQWRGRPSPVQAAPLLRTSHVLSPGRVRGYLPGLITQPAKQGAAGCATRMGERDSSMVRFVRSTVYTQIE